MVILISKGFHLAVALTRKFTLLSETFALPFELGTVFYFYTSFSLCAIYWACVFIHACIGTSNVLYELRVTLPKIINSVITKFSVVGESL